MNKLWVVEARFDWGWDICSFGTGEYCSSNYYTAHSMKRRKQKNQQVYGSKPWAKSRFRVRAYVRDE